MNSESQNSHSASRKFTLLILGVLVIGTVFFLPRFVSEPWLVDQEETLPSVPDSSPTNVAPSTAAELTRFRQESQAVLAEIMNLRDRLELQSVEQWGEVEFQQAEELVENGDEQYSYGDYAVSLEKYRQARDLLTDLQQRGQQLLTEARAEAATAVAELNTTIAATSIELAKTIAPDDSDVQALAARVETLPQVALHIDAGDQAMETDRFQRAVEEYGKALELDPEHQRARESLSRARREVTASVFRGHMSRGFAALEAGDFDGARGAFRQAGKVFPGDPAVQQALAQVANQESGRQVSNELEQAAALEAREQWSEALAIYQRLLEEDPSLTDARVRLIPTRVRADLDARLQRTIEDPLSLSSQSEFQAAQGVLSDASGIPDPGPRLAGQIAEMEAILERANSPVDVVFQSDNLTHVVLYRVAELGQFEQKSVRLRPGKYVVAGSRGGYRDVQVEFTVTGDPLQEPIVVRCEEPVG